MLWVLPTFTLPSSMFLYTCTLKKRNIWSFRCKRKYHVCSMRMVKSVIQIIHISSFIKIMLHLLFSEVDIIYSAPHSSLWTSEFWNTHTHTQTRVLLVIGADRAVWLQGAALCWLCVEKQLCLRPACGWEQLHSSVSADWISCSRPLRHDAHHTPPLLYDTSLFLVHGLHVAFVQHPLLYSHAVKSQNG